MNKNGSNTPNANCANTPGGVVRTGSETSPSAGRNSLRTRRSGACSVDDRCLRRNPINRHVPLAVAGKGGVPPHSGRLDCAAGIAMDTCVRLIRFALPFPPRMGLSRRFDLRSRLRSRHVQVVDLCGGNDGPEVPANEGMINRYSTCRHRSRRSYRHLHHNPQNTLVKFQSPFRSEKLFLPGPPLGSALRTPPCRPFRLASRNSA